MPRPHGPPGIGPELPRRKGKANLAHKTNLAHVAWASWRTRDAADAKNVVSKGGVHGG